MRILFVLLLLFFTIACSDNKPNTIIPERTDLSMAQREIQKLVDSFKLEYKDSKNKIQRDAIREKYNQRLFNYLTNNGSDTVEDIERVRVHIDTIIVNDLTITAKSHCNKDIAFQCSLTFPKEMKGNVDSLFRFAKGLTVGSDTTINFSYIAPPRFNNPFDSSLPTLTIFAFPSPQFFPKQ